MLVKRFFLLFFVGILFGSFYIVNTVGALSPDMGAIFCESRGYEYENVNVGGTEVRTCFFDDGKSCPIEDFMNETCGVDYLEGILCDDPLVPYKYECVDPFPSCLNPIENSMWCLDRIVNGHLQQYHDFACYDGWEKTDPTYDEWYIMIDPGACVNPCSEGNIMIDGSCVDQFLACKNPPANYEPSSCVDKLEIDGSMVENFSFSCMDGYVKDGNSCVAENTESFFPDVPSNLAISKAINHLVSIGVIDGYPDGTYKPLKTLNRAELMKIIIEAVYPGQATGSGCFPDVTDEWFAPYVCFAEEMGIVSGYPDGTFKPADTVNYVEALKMVFEAYGLVGSEQTDPWFQKYVDKAVDMDVLLIGIQLTEEFSRGDMAELIYKTMKYLGEV